MNVIILAGGFATRLRPLTITKPKPLLPILDKPLLDWAYDNMVNNNVSRIILSLYNMADLIMSHVRNSWVKNDIKVEYVIEEKPSGDGGALAYTIKNLGNSLSYPVIISYGDLFTTASYKELYDFHLRRGGLMTLAGTRVSDVSRYGFLEVSEKGVLKRIIEKPRELTGVAGLVNAGIYVISEEASAIIERISSEGFGKVSIAKDILPRIISAGDVYVYIYEGIWSDIGTPRDYYRANLMALKILSGGGSYIDPTARISSRAIVQDPVYIGRNVVIKDNAVVGRNTIVMSDSEIREGAYVEESMIMRKSIIDEHSIIRGSIVGEDSYIGRWVRIYEESVLGSSVYVRELSCLPPKTMVLPYKEISEDLCLRKIKYTKPEEDPGFIVL
ncbi:MAG: NDP-sugar synthase [Sulfolobales archaeon]